MKRSYRGANKKTTPDIKQYRINKGIIAKTVRLIDEETGQSEIISLFDALAKAQELELDLVEVSPNIEPPVVKILDYGKIQYQREKMMRKQKASQKKVETKCIRLTARMSDHDFDVRVENAKKFLQKGAKIKIELILRGRENHYLDKAEEMMKEFIKILSAENNIIIEQPPKKLGSNIFAMIGVK